MRCDLIGIKCWITCNSSPKIPLHSQNLLASYTCSKLFTSAKVGNVLTSHCSCLGAAWKAVLLQIVQTQSNFLRKCLRREGSHGPKPALCPQPGCREWHRTPWKLLSAAEKAIYHAEPREMLLHTGCVTAFIAGHSPSPAITNQTQTTLPWPKACGAFCQAK